ncbi:MAG: hypothetical protein ABJZ55_18345 [Fuerstiella sp.]
MSPSFSFQTRHALSLMIVTAAGLFGLTTSNSICAEDRVLQKSDQQSWFKGNMHTHSLWSDGDDYPEMIADWYQQHDYNFLVFTDHNILHSDKRWIDVEKNKGGFVAFNKLVKRFGKENVPVRNKDGRQQTKLQTFDETFVQFAKPGSYILIQGEEISDRFQNKPIHMCATNTSELLPPMHGDSVYDVMQNNINAAISRRERSGEKTIVHLNHPNFGYGVTAEQLMKVQGENFFEIFNGHPSVNDAGDATHASTERMWDIINSFRLAELQLPLMYGLATDDGHEYHKTKRGKGAQPGRGWVMVLANKLDPDALVDSLEAGQFYSSSGVTLAKIESTNSTLTVQIEPTEGAIYTIDFIGTNKGFDTKSEPMSKDEVKAKELTRKYSPAVGKTLKSVNGTTATYEFTGNELYVRAVVTSSLKHANPSVNGQVQKAWVQPVMPSRE